MKVSKFPGAPQFSIGFLCPKIYEISQKFKRSNYEKSKKVGKMLENLTLEMAANDYGYFILWENGVGIYNSASKDWNNLYINAGGVIGSGKFVPKALDENSEMFRRINLYDTEGFNEIQVLHVMVTNMSKSHKDFSEEERDRLEILRILLQLVISSIIMEEKWFSRIYKAFNSSQQEILPN
jgi:hypothetical protein